MIKKIILGGLWVAAIVVMAAAAQADTLDLTTGWNLAWNVSNSASSAPQTVSVYNGSTTSPLTDFEGYAVAIGITRVSGNGTIQVATAENPSSNSAANFNTLTPGPYDSISDTGFPNGGPGTFVSSYDSNFASNTINGPSFPGPGGVTSQNLFTMTFSPVSAPTVNSVFDIWAVGASEGLDSFWNDASFDTNAYGNTPTHTFPASSLSLGQDEDAVLLGTVSVTVTSVPEPGTLALLGAAFVGAAGYCIRRRSLAA